MSDLSVVAASVVHTSAVPASVVAASVVVLLPGYRVLEDSCHPYRLRHILWKLEMR